MSIGVRDIERAVCQRFRLTPEDLRGRDRRRKIARPRQIAMYLARELTKASLPRIGRYFHRDHTTVIHAKRRILILLAAGGRMEKYLEEIRAILEGMTKHRENVVETLKEAAE